MALQLINCVGAALVLAAFVLLQLRRVTRAAVLFNLLNMGGSFCLGLVAVFDRRYGWIVLETAWFGFSVYSLIVSRRPAPTTLANIGDTDKPPDWFEVPVRTKCSECGDQIVLPVTYFRTHTHPYCLPCVRVAYGLDAERPR